MFFFKPVQFIVMPFSLFFDKLLVFGDFSTERFDGDVFLEEFIGESVDLLFDVQRVLFTVGHDALGPGFLQFFAGGHFPDLFFGGKFKLKQLVFEQVILRDEHFQVAAVLCTVLFAHQNQMLDFTFFFVEKHVCGLQVHERLGDVILVGFSYFFMALFWHVDVALFKDGDFLVFLVFDENEVLFEGVVLKLEGCDLSFVLVFNEINLSSKGFKFSFFCIKFFGVGDGSEVFGRSEDFIIILKSLIFDECSFLTESAAVCGTGDGVLAFVFGDFRSLIFVAAFLGH